MTGEEWSEWFLLRSTLLSKLKEKIVKGSLQLTMRDMKERIFDNGKNTYGGKIGGYRDYYSRKYKKLWPEIRYERGLQIKYVDLRFTGELEKSIIVESNEDKSVLKFSNNKNLEKAQFQEWLQAYKIGANEMDIFTLSNQEIDQLEDDIASEFEDLIEEGLSSPRLKYLPKSFLK